MIHVIKMLISQNFHKNKLYKMEYFNSIRIIEFSLEIEIMK